MKKKLPTPQKLPSRMYRCQVMVSGKRVSVIDENPAIAQAKAVAMRAGLIEEKKDPSGMTVGEAIDRYIESKDAVLSPSTIRGYHSIRENSLGNLEPMQIDSLTQEAVQRHVNALAKEKTPSTAEMSTGS